MPLRILITGSRSWEDRAVIRDALRAAWIDHGRPADAVLVSGACPRGADRIAENVWAANGLAIERHPANWKPDGTTLDRSAGFRRNADMVALGADLCLAFIRAGSRGASHTARLAGAAGIETRVFTAD